jgi:anion-transporting  ArsA/GET3 family ATPase
VGKTTVAVALANYAAVQGLRVLLVDPSALEGVAPFFGKRQLSPRPTRLARRLDGVRLEPRTLLEGYFRRLLPVPVFSRLLFESRTFNALAAAAPGVTEFLIWESLRRWAGAGAWTRRRRYDLVVVDGPSTGHALRLFRAPRQFVAMVPGGRIGSVTEQLVELLSDPERTRVLLVTVPDEMAVNETIETRGILTDDLGVNLTRPVLNRVVPRRFSTREAKSIAELSLSREDDLMLAAARLQIGKRKAAERHRARLKRAFEEPPIIVQQFSGDGVRERDLQRIGSAMGRAVLSSR